MMIKVLVEFRVEAEPIGPWSSNEVALDRIRHRIEEGVTLEDQVEWDFVAWPRSCP
jgi:hypothetical protein